MAKPLPTKKFPRGARLAPRHKLLATMPFRAAAAPPAQFSMVPLVRSMFGNDQYGDCVSAEEWYAKSCDTPEHDLSEQSCIDWARKHGWLDGADLPEVMDAMIAAGPILSGQQYNDGPYHGVDYSSDAILQAAIFAGPVKIAIDADALPSGAGNNDGWFALTQGRYPNTDHCVSLCGYGSAQYLYQSLHVPLPAGVGATTPGYLLYTWSTIGFVTLQWLAGTCQEAYVRVPTTVGVPPLPGPTPVPPVPPVPPEPGPGPMPGMNCLCITTALPPGMYMIGGAPNSVEALRALLDPELVKGLDAKGTDWMQLLLLILAFIQQIMPLLQRTPQAQATGIQTGLPRGAISPPRTYDSGERGGPHYAPPDQSDR